MAVSVFASLGSAIDSWLHHLHGATIYLVCGLLVFGEASFLLGFVIPGETAALVGGALASIGNVSLVIMLVVVIVGAVIGDSVGYAVGRRLGPWLLRTRPLRNRSGVNRASEMLNRFGGPAVFLGRWVALARALVPGVTGMSGMRYRTFLIYNAAGGILWGATFVLIGYGAGKSYQSIAHAIGLYSVVLVVAIVALAAIVTVARRRRRRGDGAEPGSGGVTGHPPTAGRDQAGPT